MSKLAFKVVGQQLYSTQQPSSARKALEAHVGRLFGAPNEAGVDTQFIRVQSGEPILVSRQWLGAKSISVVEYEQKNRWALFESWARIFGRTAHQNSGGYSDQREHLALENSFFSDLTRRHVL